eukprot:1338106-Pyramimonas_sp.AAC.1
MKNYQEILVFAANDALAKLRAESAPDTYQGATAIEEALDWAIGCLPAPPVQDDGDAGQRVGEHGALRAIDKGTVINFVAATVSAVRACRESRVNAIGIILSAFKENLAELVNGVPKMENTGPSQQ